VDEDLAYPFLPRALPGQRFRELLHGQDTVVDQHLAQPDPPGAAVRLSVVGLHSHSSFRLALAREGHAWTDPTVGIGRCHLERHLRDARRLRSVPAAAVAPRMTPRC